MLSLVDVNTYYGDSHILQGISLSVRPGDVVTILGRNGVGKTTLLNSVVSFVKPRKGKIIIAGEEVTHLSTHQIMRKGLALVPQGRRVFSSLSVAENLAIPFKCVSKGDHQNAYWTIKKMYETFPTLRARRNQRAGNLSGGEQQMLAMGRALVSGPKILLLDEPSEGLAPVIVQQIADVIAKLADQRIAVLLVEQNFNMALQLASRIFVMSRGQIVHESSPQALAHNEEIKAQYLGM